MLTEREEEVLELLSAGQHNAEMAEELHITKATVEFHVHNLFRKLNAHSRVEAVLNAQELGLI